MAKSTYDEESFRFAEHFLSDHPDHTATDTDDFARHIQQAAEDGTRSTSFKCFAMKASFGPPSSFTVADHDSMCCYRGTRDLPR